MLGNGFDGHGAAPFGFMGIILGIMGGLAMGVDVFRLKKRKQLMAAKDARNVAILILVPMYILIAYATVSSGETPIEGLIACLYLSIAFSIIAVLLSFSISAMANWDLRDSVGS